MSAGRDQALKLILLEGDTGSFIDDINTHYAPLRCLVRLPGEDRVVCGEDDGVVRLYQVFRTTARTMNMEDHNLVRSFDALPSAITALAVSGDGKRVAAGDLDGHLRLFDVATGRILASVTTYRRGIFALGFSPDGSSLAMAGFDGRVRIVSSTGRLLFSFIPVPLGSGPASRGAVLTASGPGSRSRSGSPGPTAHTLPPGRNAHG